MQNVECGMQNDSKFSIINCQLSINNIFHLTSKLSTLNSQLIITVVLLLLILQVLQGLGLHIDGEVPALVAADGNPIEAHLPAVQVAVDAEVGVRQAVVGEVPAGGEGELPLGRDADIAVDVQGLHDAVGFDAHDGGVSHAGGVSEVVPSQKRPNGQG